MKKYLNEAYFGLLVGICAFVYFLFTGLTKEKLSSTNDLTVIKGTYLKHSFIDNTGVKNFTHQYYIWTENYANAFQVSASYLDMFAAKDFDLNIKHRDSITLTIPTRLTAKLNSKDNIPVTSIEANGITFLDKDKVIEYEKHLVEKNMEYVFAFGFLAAGLWVYFSRRKNYR